MRQSSIIFASATVVALAMFAPSQVCAQGVTIYVEPSYPGYGYYPPPYPSYGYAPPPTYGYTYPSYGYAYPSYGYGYGRPYYGNYWGQGRRVARRVNRRWDRWD
jgi:hypothetical protein